jgi:hypothetical protein
MHVGDLDGSSTPFGSNSWQATVMILVHDGNETPLAGVTVSGTWSGGTSGTAQCVTDSSGWCSVSSPRLRNVFGSVTFTTDSLSKDSYTYQAGANHDPDGDSDGTTITVMKP